jgi:hypothetical protein
MMNFFRWMHRLVAQLHFDVNAVRYRPCVRDGAGETRYVSGIFLKDNVMDVLHPEMVMVTMFDPLTSGKFNPCRASNR